MEEEGISVDVFWRQPTLTMWSLGLILQIFGVKFCPSHVICTDLVLDGFQLLCVQAKFS